MSWFEEWFDSPLYEKLYANRNEEEASLLADLIETEIPKSRYPKILDLGCGRGRHSIALAEKGYDVTGIDLSKEAILKARSKARAKNLKKVSFKVNDMRVPLPKRFNAIVNLFTTFGYFLKDSENILVLKSVSEMLETDGAFMIDFLNSTYVKDNLVPEESGKYADYSYKIYRKIEEGMVFKTIQFSGSDLSEPLEYVERVKLYDLDWFKTQFEATGFTLEKIYGDYSGNQFTPHKSKRLLMVARKN